MPKLHVVKVRCLKISVDQPLASYAPEKKEHMIAFPKAAGISDDIMRGSRKFNIRVVFRLRAQLSTVKDELLSSMHSYTV